MEEKNISDIDILKQLEMEGNKTLRKVTLGDLKNGFSQNYALDEEGRVIGLRLFEWQLLKSQCRLVSRLRFLTHAGFIRTGLDDCSFLSSLTQLSSLNLSWNNLSDVSISSLSSLTQLSSLNLSYNNLSDVSGLSSLTNLKNLKIDGNSLVKPPKEIAEKGMTAIHSYFQQMAEQGKARLYEARLLLVGEPGAGKTTLLKKILDPLYPVPNTEEEPTLGIVINSQWEFPYDRHKGITFQTRIWDFGGQPIQYMLHQYFLTSRSLYVLVSDDREQRTRFDYWFDIIKVLGENSPVLVVLNEKKHRSISDFDYDKYKKRYEHLYEIERRDVDFSGQDPRLAALIGKIAAMLRGLKHIGDELPRQWIPIRRELERIKKEKQIAIDRYFAICRQHGLSREEDMLTLCGYLNALGVVLHYKDERSLENTLFVDPHWIVDALYMAISDKTPVQNKGRFKKEWLFHLWKKKDYSYDERCKLLNLMLKDNFEICYRMAGGRDEEYMVPMLLPDVEPAYEPLPGSGSLKFRFQYPFMPEGIIARLIVRLHEDIEKKAGQDLTWKKGFILNRQGTRARVAEDRSGKGLRIIDINVSGPAGSRRDFLSVIRNEVRKIHQKSFKEIDVEEMVPCNCPSCSRAETPHYFEYSELQRYLRAGESIIKCSLSIKPVEIRQLIEEVVPREEIGPDFRTPGKAPYSFPEPLPLPLELMTGTVGRVRQLKEWEDKIINLREALETEIKKQAVCNNIAEGKARRSSWWFVGLSLVLIGVWAVLILFVYDWGTMEKWTYLGGGFWAVIAAVYCAVFKRKLESEALRAERLEKEKYKLYALHGVNPGKIRRLNAELQEAESRRRALLDSA
jgi:internalin A